MRRGEAFLEQQPHRVALDAEGRLNSDENVAETLSEHEDRAAVALLLAGRGTPLRLDLLQMTLPAHVIARRDPRMDVGDGAESGRIAADDLLAQRIDGFGQIHLDSPPAEAQLRVVVERFEHRQERRRAGIARIRREIEQHDADLAFAARFERRRATSFAMRAANIVGALGMHRHILVARARAAAEDQRPGGAIEFGDRHHDGATRPATSRAPRRPIARASEIRRDEPRCRAHRARPASPRRPSNRCTPDPRPARSR